MAYGRSTERSDVPGLLRPRSALDMLFMMRIDGLWQNRKTIHDAWTTSTSLTVSRNPLCLRVQMETYTGRVELIRRRIAAAHAHEGQRSQKMQDENTIHREAIVQCA